MKVLAFAGSNSSRSINRQLVKFAVSRLNDGVEVELLDLNDFEMPIYSADREAEGGIPPLAAQFASKVDAADLLIISLAEHNGAYTVAFKNIFDWISRIPTRKAWGNKPMVLMSATPGPRGGTSVLDAAQRRFPFSGGVVIASFSLPNFAQNFDSNRRCIINPDKMQELNVLMDEINNRKY